jgi:hypothetical protein
VADPKQGDSLSFSPEEASLRLTTKAKRFSWDSPKYGMVQNDIYETWMAAKDGHSRLHEDLRVFNSLYEMEHTADGDTPWVGASNLVLPTIPAESEALRDYIIMAVFTPRLFLAQSPVAEEQQYAPKMEAWLNSLLAKSRNSGDSWFEQLISIIQASTRDGSAAVMATWLRKTRNVPTVSNQPQVDEDGNMLLDDDNQPVTERVISYIKEKVSYPVVEALILKDVKWVPAEARHIQKAAAVFITRWMYEKELLALCDGMGGNPKNGVFSRDAIEQVLAYVPVGQTDLSNDPEGSYDKDAGGQLDTSIGQGSLTSDTFRNRGPVMIELCMSEQHDMNDDGIVERNWFWLHPISQTMIGWMPYEYLIDRWPIEMFSMFPRIQQIPGYSIPERLVDTVDSMTANKNQRINYNDMVTNPILVHKTGAMLKNKDKAIMPGTQYEAEDPAGDFVWLAPPQISGTSFQEDSQDTTNIAKITGQSAPFTGGQGPTRQTATQAKQAAAAQSTRSATITLLFRFFLRKFINLIIALYRQEAEEDFTAPELTGTDKTPREIIQMHWKIDVSGIADPVDAATRRTDTIMFATEAQKLYPARFQMPTAQHALVQALADAFPYISNLASIIGTAEDAQKLEQQMQQAAQAQQQAGGPPPK